MRRTKPQQVAAPPKSPYPPAFVDFMMRHWRRPPGRLPPRVRGLPFFARRRRALRELFPHDVLIVPTGHEKCRANDTFYRFRPGTDFFYLTGNMEPDCQLVLGPAGRLGGCEEILFVEENPGRTDPSFFNRGELWVGPRLGVAASRHRFGVAACRPLSEWPAFLAEQVALAKKTTAGGAAARQKAGLRYVPDVSPAVDRACAGAPPDDLSAAPSPSLPAALSEMRLIKDAHEVRSLARACQSSVRGFEDVARQLAAAHSERQVEGIFNLRARTEGYDVGYNTIAAAGHHACTLHWTHNDGPLKGGQLLLLDAGVEGRDLYTADITRTLPVGGRFSPAQRQVYELVERAQRAALAEVRPGRDFMAPNRAAMEVLTRGLIDWGILECSLEEAMREDCGFYRRYTLHNVSHMLGLDVHDCAQARQKTYRFGPLRAGMVLTVEPGLYFQPDDLTVPPRLRGIGVRIEDDVLVTARGCRILSCLPREASAVERWMQRLGAASG